MQHQGTIPIQTNRLLLRRFEQGDSETAFRNWTSDEKVTTFLRWPVHKSVQTTQEVLQTWRNAYAEKDFYEWAIVLKDDSNEPIGTISMVGQDEALDLVQIGYCIGSRWWNQGITSEALCAVISFFFEQVKANRIEAQRDPNNPNSEKVMEAAACKQRTRCGRQTSNQRIADTAACSILAQEYVARSL